MQRLFSYNIQTKVGSNLNRYTYVLNNPLKYTDPSGYAYYGFGGANTSSAGAMQSMSIISQQIEDFETRRSAFLSNQWHDVTLFDMIGDRGGAVSAQNASGSASFFGFTSLSDNSPQAFVQNYYAFSGNLKYFKYLYNRYGGMLPIDGIGGLTNSFEGFKNFMLDQARNNPKEVHAYSFSYAGTDQISYFIAPWKNNKHDESYPSLSQIPGLVDGKISDVYEIYHTHPASNRLPGLSRLDIDAHYVYRIPISAIEKNRDVYRIDLIIKGKGRFGQDFIKIPNRGFIGEKSKW